MQILKDIFQVGGDLNGITFDVQGAMWNDGNSYVIRTSDGLIMVDCGCGDTMDQIFANMRYWGLSPDDIRYCILTHPHYDHAGGGHLLKERGVRFIASSGTADAVASGDERCAGYLYHKTFRAFTVDQVVSDDEVFEVLGISFRVLYLPGHSMGCTAFSFQWEGRHIVFSGDVIGTLGIGDFGWSGSFDFNKEAYLQSLIRFSKLDMDIMLPGHGLTYFHKPRRLVEYVLNQALMLWR